MPVSESNDSKSGSDSQTDTTGSPSLAPPPAASPWRLRLRYLVIALVVLIGGAFAAREIHQRIIYVYEYDARIAGELITVSSRVAGWLSDVDVKEGDSVKAGDVLVRIDDRESRLLAEQLENQIKSIDAQRRRLESERALMEKQTASRIETQRAGVNAAQAAAAALKAELDLAKTEMKRSEELLNKKVVSRREYDRRRSEMSRLNSEHHMTVAGLEEARHELREAEVEKGRLELIDDEIAERTFDRESLSSQLSLQRLDRDDRTIKSRIDGVVDRVFVEPGEYIQPGQRLLLIHNPDRVWIDANVKETDISDIKIGQTVQVTVDAYSDLEFTGRVIAIGNAATSEFALLPTPNPSGNFTKITQRLRVRIAIEQEEQLLRPGMMVEVFIDVR